MSERIHPRKPFIEFMGLAALLMPGVKAQLTTPPYVYSANNSASYSTTLAQGSLFVAFGSALGPTILVQVQAFPLPSVLAGTSVTVTAGSTTLNCPMVYTSYGQVAAILPSQTPAGPATITVEYNGKTAPYGGSTTPVTVAQNAVAIYTTTSSGSGAGIFTGLDGTLKTLTNSAKPGELVYAWGTGLGPITTPDNMLPTSFPSFPNVQVWAGGLSASITYAGRSGCCAGVDQVVFTVPAVANGCNIPVTIVSGNYSSNTVALPVNASGGACSDSGPTLPTSFLTKATAGQPVRVAAIAIGPTSVGNTTLIAQALAQRLSAAFHTRVPESDAERLMRAYATRDPKQIRTALAKYARQWKTLDARTKASVAAQIGQTQEGAVADFGTYTSEGVAATLASAQLATPGSCVIVPVSGFSSGLGAVGTGLDAGSSLLLTGASTSLTLLKNTAGLYHAVFNSSITGPNIPLGSYTIRGFGGKDVGAFNATLTVGSHLAISNKPSIATVNRSQPLTISWTGGVTGNYVMIGGYTPNILALPESIPNAYFVCVEDAGKGTFTIPSYILSSMNATPAGKGILLIAPHPLSNQITLPGIDLAYFTDGSSDSAEVTFK